jgi:hypothetical protein
MAFLHLLNFFQTKLESSTDSRICVALYGFQDCDRNWVGMIIDEDFMRYSEEQECTKSDKQVNKQKNIHKYNEII